MRIIYLSLFFVFLSVCAKAQDSSVLDLGRVQVQKSFLHHSTIKGEDLRRFPHADLGEAIRAWFFGLNASPERFVYVIDGNFVADVNLYPVDAIDEITLVQNAASQLNGGFNQQHLIVIKTKKATKPGNEIFVHGGSQLVDRRFRTSADSPPADSEKHFYHQYGVSGHRKTERLNAGVSLNYLHDVLPNEKASNLIYRSPYHLDRYRVNTYLDYKIHPKHVISAKANYTGQESALERDIMGALICPMTCMAAPIILMAK